MAHLFQRQSFEERCDHEGGAREDACHHQKPLFSYGEPEISIRWCTIGKIGFAGILRSANLTKSLEIRVYSFVFCLRRKANYLPQNCIAPEREIVLFITNNKICDNTGVYCRFFMQLWAKMASFRRFIPMVHHLMGRQGKFCRP